MSTAAQQATDVVALLREALGSRVDTSHEALDAARADKSGHASSAAPLAVVHAASIADVQQTMQIATATRTPVVTRGAGTGLAG
ncbi:FAD-binding protein, partial [Microbacterium sp. zg.Y909]|uniref:FAD-binding protein n=1 Tax=Microbacterium sp. zg.Y909 TaxID=2969413 RepID=UPI00214B512C